MKPELSIKNVLLLLGLLLSVAASAGNKPGTGGRQKFAGYLFACFEGSDGIIRPWHL